LQKVAGNKKVCQQSIWGQDPVNQSNKLNHHILLKTKTAKITKQTTDIMVVVATLERPAVKPSIKPTSRGSG
jgi:hypothetical protein